MQVDRLGEISNRRQAGILSGIVTLVQVLVGEVPVRCVLVVRVLVVQGVRELVVWAVQELEARVGPPVGM